MGSQKFYRNHVKPHVPPAAHEGLVRAISEVRSRPRTWRLGRLPTRLLGPRWKRSLDSVDIDITYACNLRCNNCNRSCSQAPTAEHMSLGQVAYFLAESRARGIRWARINLVGGEPTCHPEFLDIVGLVLRHCDEFSPATAVEVFTNGCGEQTKRMLNRLPARVRVDDSAKTGSAQPGHVAFNVAPVDLSRFARTDFANGCWVLQDCGLGVGPYGYYPCGVASGIDRIFGFDLGRKVLPEPGDTMDKELRVFCPLCGQFAAPTRGAGGPVASPTWAGAYERWRREPRRLSRLPEVSRSEPASGRPGRPTAAEDGTGGSPAEGVCGGPAAPPPDGAGAPRPSAALPEHPGAAPHATL
jgi:hypothetical protein